MQLPPRYTEQDREQTGDEQEISFQGIFCQDGKQAQLLLWTPQDQGVQVMMLIIMSMVMRIMMRMLMSIVIARMKMMTTMYIENDQDGTKAKLGSMDTGTIENDDN